MEPASNQNYADLFRQWNHGGRAQLIAIAQSLAPLHATSIPSPLNSFVHVTFTLAVCGDSPIPVAIVSALLEDLLADELLHQHAVDMASIAVDTMWVMDIEREGYENTEASTERQRLLLLAKEVMNKNLIPATTLKERLEVGFIAELGLVSNKSLFDKRTVRMNTALLYKQQKFNLLREESEGYSKLITELTTNGAGSEVDIEEDDDGEDVAMNIDGGAETRRWKSQERLKRRVNMVLKNVKSLIGYFDLDPNRVLDIILDVFAENIVQHHRFFLELLEQSPWRPRGANRNSFKGTVSTEGSKSGKLDQGENSTRKRSFDEVSDKDESGNNVCAQILGFKFKYYQSSDCKEDTPEDLYLVSALLLKHEFIRLADLYPHLTPTDDAIGQQYTEYVNKLKDQANSGTVGLLAMYGPLVDDRDSIAPGMVPQHSISQAGLSVAVSTGASQSMESLKIDEVVNSAEEPPKPREPPNQKVGLLKALLAIGDLPHGLFFLYKFDNISGPHPEVADLLCRLLGVVVHPIYKDYRPSARFPPGFSMPRAKWSKDSGTTNTGKKTTAVILTKDTKQIKSSRPDTAHEYFYRGWKDGLPECTSLLDLQSIVMPLLKFVGPRIYRDLVFVAKLCRLGKASVKEHPNDAAVKKAWIDMTRFYFLPTISLIYANPGMVNEVWSLVKHFSYQERFALYGEWKNVLYKKYPELKVVQSETEKDTKSTMRRLSKENYKQMGRTIAKTSHSNPTLVFSIMLDQVQGYDNLVIPVVDACKYLTNFGYDVLTYVMIEKLSGDQGPSRSRKERLKEDGTTIMDWLQALAAFCGTLLKKYPTMDATPVIQYIVNQLKDGNTHDLYVLKELVTKMAGIEVLVGQMSDQQLIAMGGGETLRNEALMVAGGDSRRSSKKSSSRLAKCLLEADVALALLILIARQRQTCIFHERVQDVRHLKLLGNLFDQAIFLQYVEFLATNLTKDEYARLVPPIEDFCLKYGLEPEVAFHILRPQINQTMQVVDEAQLMEDKVKAEREIVAAKAAAEASMSTTPVSSQNQSESAAASQDLTQSIVIDAAPNDTLNGTDVTMSDVNTTMSKTSEQRLPEIWHSGLTNIIEQARKILPDKVKAITPEFYVTFWQLSLYDIHVPRERYKEEIEKQRKVIQKLDTDKTDMSANAVSTRRRNKDRALATIERLERELQEQEKNFEKTMKRLNREKDYWFVGFLSRADIITEFIQYCIHPRSMFSATDAIFCAKFIKLMHSLGTANFSSLTLYDKLLGDYINAEVQLCTEVEAGVYSRFLVEILQVLSSWHENADIYSREGQGDRLPGFQKKWISVSTQTTSPKSADINLLQYEDYRHVLYKWHCRMNKVFENALMSGEHMRTRNAITILTKIEAYFPKMKAVGLPLSMKVKDIIEKETKEDLKTLAKGYQAILQKASSKWVEKNQFHQAQQQSKQGARPKTSSPSVGPGPRPNGGGGTGGSSGVSSSGPSNSTGNGVGSSNGTGGNGSGSLGSSSSSSVVANNTGPRQRSPGNKPSSASASGTGEKEDTREVRSKQVDLNVPSTESANTPTALKDRRPDTPKTLGRDNEPPISVRHSSSSSSRLPAELAKMTSSKPPTEPAADRWRDGRDDALNSRKDSRESLSRSSSSATSALLIVDNQPVSLTRESGRDKVSSYATDSAHLSSRAIPSEASGYRDTHRENRDRDMRDTSFSKQPRESKEVQSRDSRDTRTARPSTRDSKDSRETREDRDGRDGRDARDSRDARDGRDARDSRDARDGRESRDGRDAREGRENRDGRDARDVREPRERDSKISTSAPTRDARHEMREERREREPLPRKNMHDAARTETRVGRDTREVPIVASRPGSPGTQGNLQLGVSDRPFSRPSSLKESDMETVEKPKGSIKDRLGGRISDSERHLERPASLSITGPSSLISSKEKDKERPSLERDRDRRPTERERRDDRGGRKDDSTNGRRRDQKSESRDISEVTSATGKDSARRDRSRERHQRDRSKESDRSRESERGSLARDIEKEKSRDNGSSRRSSQEREREKERGKDPERDRRDVSDRPRESDKRLSSTPSSSQKDRNYGDDAESSTKRRKADKVKEEIIRPDKESPIYKDERKRDRSEKDGQPSGPGEPASKKRRDDDINELRRLDTSAERLSSRSPPARNFETQSMGRSDFDKDSSPANGRKRPADIEPVEPMKDIKLVESIISPVESTKGSSSKRVRLNRNSTAQDDVKGRLDGSASVELQSGAPVDIAPVITRSNKSDPNDRRERDRDREREPLSEKVRGPKEKDKEGKHRDFPHHQGDGRDGGRRGSEGREKRHNRGH